MSLIERTTQAAEIAREPRNLKRTIRIALVVGSILFVVNQMDVVLSGAATSGTWLKVATTYVVPFFVANLGIIGARRDAQLATVPAAVQSSYARPTPLPTMETAPTYW
jgi:hypothetical protein